MNDNSKVLFLISLVLSLGVGFFIGSMTGKTHSMINAGSHAEAPVQSMTHDMSGMAMHQMDATSAHHAHPHTAPAEAALVEKLKAGGYILFTRHDRTELDKTLDDEPLNFENCASQRELSPAGIASAKENGEALKIIGVPVGASYASPFCRTYDTAVAMYGKTEKVMKLSGRATPTDTFDMKKAGDYLGEFIFSLSPIPGKNIAITAHYGTSFMLTGVHTHEGDVAVFKVENGKLKHQGTIHPSTWSDVIHDAVRAQQ